MSLFTACCLLVVQLRLGSPTIRNANAAQPSTRPSSLPARKAPSDSPHVKLGLQGSVGLGAAYAALTAARNDGQGHHSFGLALDGRLGYRFVPWLGINLSLTWTLTHWLRVRNMAEWGVDTFNWSKGAIADVAGAYAKVNDWVGDGGDTKSLRIVGGFFAYFGITIVLVVVALGIVLGPFAVILSPLAATSSLLGAATATFYWTRPDKVEPFGEAGIGGGLLVHSETNDAMAGWGPVVGAGLRWNRYGLGLRLFWSPPRTQTEPQDVNTSALVGLLTLNVHSQ